MNFARLNHVLIPSTKAGRDRFRHSRAARLLTRLMGGVISLSEEGRAVVLFWVLAGVVGLEIATTQAYLLWSALTGLLAVAIATRRRFDLTGVNLTVHAPRRAAVGEEVGFVLRLENGGDVLHQAIRMRGPFLPWDGRYSGPPPSVTELAPGCATEVTMHARFRARGEHHLDTFTARALAPLGLTTGAAIESNDVRLLVVPRIAPVRRITVAMAERVQPGGIALASRAGESRELVGVRPYRPGDPLRDLHARRSARVGEPVVREYTQEYFTRVAVIVDSDGADVPERRFEAALSLAAGAVARLTRGEALIDLIAVGADVHRLTLGRNLGFVDQALDLLACVRPTQGLDLSVLEARLQPHVLRLSSAVMVVLRWDERRRDIAAWLARSGVPCRVLLVASEMPSPTGVPPWPNMTSVTAAQIEGSVELEL